MHTDDWHYQLFDVAGNDITFSHGNSFSGTKNTAEKD